MAKRNALQILGDAVRCGREAAGLSQEALGERADLHRNEIGALERGEKNISFVNLLRVCAALRVTPGDLLADLSLARAAQTPAQTYTVRASREIRAEATRQPADSSLKIGRAHV